MRTLCRIEDRKKRIVAQGLDLFDALAMSRNLGQGHVVVRESDGVPLSVVAADKYADALRSLLRSNKREEAEE